MMVSVLLSCWGMWVTHDESPLYEVFGWKNALPTCTLILCPRNGNVPWRSLLQTPCNTSAEFTAADTWILLSNRLNILYYKRFLCQGCKHIVFVLIIRLTSKPKQFTEAENTIVFVLCTKFLYCLGPIFFAQESYKDVLRYQSSCYRRQLPSLPHGVLAP